MAGLNASIGTVRALRINLAAFFLGQALPTSIAGDAWRVWKIRSLGFGIGTGLRGVLIDRTTAMIGLVLVVLPTAPLLLARMPDPAMRWSVAAGLGIGAALLALALSADRLSGRWASGRLERSGRVRPGGARVAEPPGHRDPDHRRLGRGPPAGGRHHVADRGQPGAGRSGWWIASS